MYSVKAKVVEYNARTNKREEPVTIHTDLETLSMIEFPDGRIECFAIREMQETAITIYNVFVVIKPNSDGDGYRRYYIESLQAREAGIYYRLEKEIERNASGAKHVDSKSE